MPAGQPIYYEWMKHETTEFITLELQICVQSIKNITKTKILGVQKSIYHNNNVNITKVISTYKDCSELDGIKAVFPNATSLLCQFHICCTVDTRDNNAKSLTLL